MSNTCVFMYGRMNPVHLGHGMVFNEALKLKDSNTDVKLYLSSTQDFIKNPLPLDIKQYYISEFFPDISDSIQKLKVKNLFDIIKELNGEYENLVFVGGSDRCSDFQKLLDKYNGVDYNFKSIKSLQAGGNRTGNIYSSTLMRNSVQNDDFTTFGNCLPGNNENLKYDMFCGIQKYMMRK